MLHASWAGGRHLWTKFAVNSTSPCRSYNSNRVSTRPVSNSVGNQGLWWLSSLARFIVLPIGILQHTQCCPHWILTGAGPYTYSLSTVRGTFTYWGEKKKMGWMRTRMFRARGQSFEVASKARIRGSCLGSGELNMQVVDLAKSPVPMKWMKVSSFCLCPFAYWSLSVTSHASWVGKNKGLCWSLGWGICSHCWRDVMYSWVLWLEGWLVDPVRIPSHRCLCSSAKWSVCIRTQASCCVLWPCLIFC